MISPGHLWDYPDSPESRAARAELARMADLMRIEREEAAPPRIYIVK